MRLLRGKHNFNLKIFIEGGGLSFLDWDFSKVQFGISHLIFKIWTNDFQLLTSLAKLFLKMYKKVGI